MKKKVIVACGGAVATSTIAANHVKDLAKKNDIDVDICQCRISEIPPHLDDAVLIVPTSRIKKDYGIPCITGMPFISGIGVEKTERAILDVLNKS